MAFCPSTYKKNREQSNNKEMNQKTGKREIEVKFNQDDKTLHKIKIKETKRISDLVEKIYELEEISKRKTKVKVKLIYCDNIMKNLNFIRMKLISDIFPDANNVIKIYVYIDDDEMKNNNLNHNDYEDIFNLHLRNDINKNEIKSYPFERFIFSEKGIVNDKDTFTIHSYFYSYSHYFPKTRIISFNNKFINQEICINNIFSNVKLIKLEVRDLNIFLNHLRIIEQKNKNIKLRTNLVYDCYNDNDLKSYNDFYKNMKKHLDIISKKLEKNMDKLYFKELSITIHPFSFDYVNFLYSNEVVGSCDILNIKLILSYSNNYEMNPDKSFHLYNKINILENFFKFLKYFNADYVNLKLIGVCFNSRIKLSEEVKDETIDRKNIQKEKERTLSLKIVDVRNEFNNESNIQYFYKYFCFYCNKNYLKKLTLEMIVIYSPIILIKLGEIIDDLNIEDMKFKNIGVRFKINEINYISIQYFHDMILRKRLSRLVFKNFPILDISFMHKFSNYVSTKNDIIYEFTNSMINREFEVLKYDNSKGYYLMEASSNINICFNLDKFNIKNLFRNVKSIKLMNFQLGGMMFFNKKSNFFKKIMYKSDFEINIERLVVDNCDVKEYNVFIDEENLKKFKMSLDYPHEENVMKIIERDNLIYYKLSEVDEKFNFFNKLNDLFMSLKEIVISKELDFKFKIPSSIKKLSLKDVIISENNILIDLDKTSIDKLSLKFSKDTAYYGVKTINIKYIKYLTLSRYAIYIFLTGDENKHEYLNLEELTVKFISESMQIKKNKSIFSILNGFNRIKKLSIFKSDFKEDFKQKAQKVFINLKRVELDFDTVYNFIIYMISDIKNVTEKDILGCIQQIVNYFVDMSKLLHSGNIYIDGKPIIFEDNLERLANKINISLMLEKENNK